MIKHQKSVNTRNIPEMLLYCQENTNRGWENLQLQAPAVTVFVCGFVACLCVLCVFLPLTYTCISSLQLFCGGVFLLFILKVITNCCLIVVVVDMVYSHI